MAYLLFVYTMICIGITCLGWLFHVITDILWGPWEEEEE